MLESPWRQKKKKDEAILQNIFYNEWEGKLAKKKKKKKREKRKNSANFLTAVKTL